MVAFRASMALWRAVKVEPPQGTGTRMRAHKELLSDLCLTAKSVIIADENAAPWPAAEVRVCRPLEPDYLDKFCTQRPPFDARSPQENESSRVVMDHTKSAARVTREGGERRRGGTCHPLDFPLSVGVIHGGFFMGDALQPIIPASVILGSSRNSFISC
ncbi:hypothetical protein Bbelb_174450 [Branchiostoma belcheri]|nr:hypothetical protein Bbelb_174450 [Branchiostoma belcheri]